LVVVVSALLTVTLRVPTVPFAQLLFVLAYVPVIVGLPTAVPVKVVLQAEVTVPELVNVQEVGLKVPPEGEIVHATVPSGGPIGAMLVSVSVAVQVVEAPSLIDVELQVTLSVLLSVLASVNDVCA